ncbi:hypothetical protein ACUXJ9_001196 [Staphylococcus caledonicus]|uniref:hypothetical protein n=1 Tax=Staphylococcus TaxID=1279 RepID=UPI001F561590|nr:hypothetical protein [Staphylococcus sp. acrmy]MCI2946895.1 hypothetical protein [Staphylococcus sp. acrmy]
MVYTLLGICVILLIGVVGFPLIYGFIDGSKNPGKYPNFLSKEEQRRQEHRKNRKDK